MHIVFVIPVYNERESLRALAEGIAAHTAGHSYRVIFVDDGSTDGSWEELVALREAYLTVDVVRLRRNFGKTSALATGIARAEGDVLVTMDADLQDDPAELPKLLAKLEEGYDVVVGWKANRRDPLHKTLPSRIYNAMVAWLFHLPLHDVNSGFKVMRMEVARRLPLYGELHRMIAVYADAMGYRVTEAPVRHHPRRYGESKYGVSRFLKGALDVLTTWFLARHGQSPHHELGKAGCFGVLAGIGFGVLGLAGIGAHLAGFLNRGASLTILLLCLAAAFVLWGLGVLVFIGGLIAELIVQRHPPGDTAANVAEEHRG
ncbi:MAG: glycosyltransferase family 2 protein [Candidatus Hydrogenedentota bacterium]